MNAGTLDHGFLKQNAVADSDRKKSSTVWYAVILGGVLLSYFLIYANKAFPYVDGWNVYYIELIKHGYFPYKDFFYYLPPGNLIMDGIFWSLSGGLFLVYRLLRMAERILMMELLYFGLVKYFKPKYVCLACILGGIFGSAAVYDLLGDYNQTAEMTLMVITLLATRFADAATTRKKLFFLTWAGVSMGWLFMLKQTHSIAAILCYFAFLSFYAWTEKDKNYWKYCVATIGGFLATVGAFAVVLLANGAFIPFVQQVYGDTSAKGSLLDILVMSLVRAIFGEELEGRAGMVVFIGLALILCAISRLVKGKLFVAPNLKYTAMIIGGIGILFWGVASYARSFVEISWHSAFLPLMVLLLVFPISILVFRTLAKDGDTKRFDVLQAVSFLAFFAAGCCLIVTNSYGITNSLFQSFQVDSLYTLIFHVLLYAILTEIGYQIFFRIRHKRWKISLPKFVLLVGAFAHSYTTIMAAGANHINCRAFFFVLPVTFLLLYDKKAMRSYSAKGIAAIVMIVLCFVSLSQKVMHSYSWWGYEEAPLSEKTEAVGIPALKGFRFSKSEKDLWESSVSVIENNTKEGDTVWNFPYTPIFQILTNNYEMVGKVPVYFFDVCSDRAAIDDAEILQQTPPDMVIWCDVGNTCWTTHEELYRTNGYCGQREIQRWFASVKDIKYELVGQNERMYFYRLKETAPESLYISISNWQRINETAELSNCKGVPAPLKGKGTARSPYLVENYADLCALRDAVNNGCNYADLYVKQTAHIDVPKTDNWVSIGNSYEEYFAGVYDGGGYEIRGLTSWDVERSALFGRISGTLLNIRLTDVDLSGAYVCGVASFTNSGGRILNCSVSGRLQGDRRASGISEDFNGGTIENCYSNAELIAPMCGQIVSYNASKIENCVMDHDSFPVEIETVACTIGALDSVTLQEKYNGYVKTLISRDFGDHRFRFCTWEIQPDGSVAQSQETYRKALIDEPAVVIVLAVVALELAVVGRWIYCYRKKKSQQLSEELKTQNDSVQ